MNLCQCPLTILPYEGEAQLEHMASVTVCVFGSQAGQKLWRHAADRRVDVDSGENPIVLTQQAVENQQCEGRLRRVCIYDDVTESTQVLIGRRKMCCE